MHVRVHVCALACCAYCSLMAEPRWSEKKQLPFLFPVSTCEPARRSLTGREACKRRRPLWIVPWPFVCTWAESLSGFALRLRPLGPTWPVPTAARPGCRIGESVFPAPCSAHRSAQISDLLVLTCFPLQSAPCSGPGPWRLRTARPPGAAPACVWLGLQGGGLAAVSPSFLGLARAP